jgi:small-conductance mechanosensitive channel
LNRKLFVSLNLNLLFDNIQNLEDNVQQVYDGVNQVLNKSQESHFEKFLMILDTCKDIKNKLDNIKNYRTHISSVIEKYETLITRSNHASNIITDKLVTLKKPDNISSDAYYINEKSKLENKLQNLNNVKGKAIEKLAILRDKDSNLLLKSDKILFDNIIMLNNVNNNLKELEVK